MDNQECLAFADQIWPAEFSSWSWMSCWLIWHCATYWGAWQATCTQSNPRSVAFRMRTSAWSCTRMTGHIQRQTLATMVLYRVWQFLRSDAWPRQLSYFAVAKRDLHQCIHLYQTSGAQPYCTDHWHRRSVWIWLEVECRWWACSASVCGQRVWAWSGPFTSRSRAVQIESTYSVRALYSYVHKSETQGRGSCHANIS